ncbi:MAG TPA: IS630 family transposase [Vicinamibacterales bacterium]|jgi:transposase|nr:IS630 family transposase [Vicinamibacterales bacterium]
MPLRYRVDLEERERQQLEGVVAGGTRAVRRVKRAQILLAAAGGETDAAIATMVRVGTSTVYRTKRRFVEESLEAALSEDPRPGGKRKLTGSEEALLIATACSTPPPGRARWTLALLADAVVALTPHTRVSRHTIRRRLAENDLKPWQQKMWCVPKIDAEYVARMEDVLDLYTHPPSAGTAVVCVDESPRQLIGEVRPTTPVAPGRPARQDYEYRRTGTANVFLAVDAHRPWRAAKVTERRAAVDFAGWMRDLVDGPYAGYDRIQIVLDNLSTHTPAAFYEAFAPVEARRVLRKLEFHYVPKHASWLNMVEIEIGVLATQCLARRIPDLVMLTTEVDTWIAARNQANIAVRWMFGIGQARVKLGHAYPSHSARDVAA